MKINIGSGSSKIEGFLSCDYNPNLNTDYVFDLEKDSFPFPDNSVDVVVAHHILEHLGEGYFHCLQELYRVCKHGSLIDVRVPHHRHDSYAADPTHRRPITVMGFQLFSKKFNKYCRDEGFASSRLADQYNVDFEILDYKYIPDPEFKEKSRGYSPQQLEEYSREHNNIIQEIQIKLIVVKE